MSTRHPRRRQTVFVGSKIRQLRKERTLTQAELASRIGVQQSDLCRMENGEYKVSLDTLFRILAVFGMEIGDFFREELPAGAPSDAEQELLRHFQRLDPTAREEVLDFVRYKSARRIEAWRS
jgi:transcriptional regulator with XRE-family HTH domain